jgi:hypothetical protein
LSSAARATAPSGGKAFCCFFSPLILQVSAEELQANGDGFRLNSCLFQGISWERERLLRPQRELLGDDSEAAQDQEMIAIWDRCGRSCPIPVWTLYRLRASALYPYLLNYYVLHPSSNK